MGTAILMEMQIGLPMMKTVGDVRTARKIARSASGCPLPELYCISFTDKLFVRQNSIFSTHHHHQYPNYFLVEKYDWRVLLVLFVRMGR
mgnify:CR=1 FL=1